MVNVKEAIHILSLKGVCDKLIHLVGLILREHYAVHSLERFSFFIEIE